MGSPVSIYLDSSTLASLDSFVAKCADKDRAAGLSGRAVTNRSKALTVIIKEYLDAQPSSQPSIDDIRHAVIPVAESYGAKSLKLFGSYARGDANENSDIDILLDKGDVRGLKVLDFEDELSRVLGKQIDIVTTEGASDRFLKRVEKDLVSLYDAG